MKYLQPGSALLFVVLITSTCALYMRSVIRNAYYSEQYARMRTEHVHDEYILYGFREMVIHWVADNYELLMSTLKGGQRSVALSWPQKGTYRAQAHITKKSHMLIIVIERQEGALRSIECRIQRQTKKSRAQFNITYI